jgi:hypothetical protein
MIGKTDTEALLVKDPKGETKVLRSWLIHNSQTGARRIVHEKPTRWRPEVGRTPHPHEVQWDEAVYRMHLELIAPEVIDGEMDAVLNEDPPIWDKRPETEMTPETFMAQEIFRRASRIVPPKSYGVHGGLGIQCRDNEVHISLPIGRYCISVKRTGDPVTQVPQETPDYVPDQVCGLCKGDRTIVAPWESPTARVPCPQCSSE